MIPMNPQNRIVTLIDFSAYSSTLVRFASEFSRLIHAKVVFVHQLPGLVPSMADPESRRQIMEIEKQEALAKLKALTRGYAFEGEAYVVSGDPLLSLLGELKHEAYFDWVFVGLKGTGILRQLFIGSSTLKIIDDSELLTVAIPIREESFAPGKLILATNYKYPINRTQLDIVLSGLSGHIKEIEFLTVLTPNDDERQALDYLNELRHAYETYQPSLHVFEGNNAFEQIKDYMKGKKDAFLVVQQGSRSLKDNLFRKFMINELVYAGSTPLIVLSQ